MFPVATETYGVRGAMDGAIARGGGAGKISASGVREQSGQPRRTRPRRWPSLRDAPLDLLAVQAWRRARCAEEDRHGESEEE